jgi:hypothetical protein
MLSSHEQSRSALTGTPPHTLTGQGTLQGIQGVAECLARRDPAPPSFVLLHTDEEYPPCPAPQQQDFQKKQLVPVTLTSVNVLSPCVLYWMQRVVPECRKGRKCGQDFCLLTPVPDSRTCLNRPVAPRPGPSTKNARDQEG